MTFLMIATIGYGGGVDIWHRPELEVFTMTIAFAGVAVMTYFFSSVTAIVLIAMASPHGRQEIEAALLPPADDEAKVKFA